MGVVAYFRNHLNLNLSQWKEGSHDSYLWLRVNRGATLDLFVYMVYDVPIVSKHKSESLFQNLAVDIVEVQTLRGIVLLGGDFNARLQCYQIPLTIVTFVNCYKRLSSWRQNNQALWLNNKIVTPVLAAGTVNSWTYAMTLGCSLLMVEHPVTNQGSSFA
jgi:hypothetical protein